MFNNFINIFKRKKVIIVTIFLLTLLVCAFLSIKTGFFYEIINYIDTYFKYYFQEYLGSNIDLLVSSKITLFIENDVMGILSFGYLWNIIHQTIFYNIYMICLPLLIFMIVGKRLYDEIHGGLMRTMILKIGRRAYASKTVIYHALVGGFIALIPQLILFLILLLTYGLSSSPTHVLANPSLISSISLQIYQNFNPMLIAVLDLIQTFLYGCGISVITILIIVFSKKFLNAIISFSLLTVGISIVLSFLKIAFNPFALLSIYKIYDAIMNISYSPFLIVLTSLGVVLCLMIGGILLVKRRAREYL